MIRANPPLGVRVTRRAGSNARKALTPEHVKQTAGLRRPAPERGVRLAKGSLWR